MLCSPLVEGCFGRYGSNAMMTAAVQMECLAKIEERGIVHVLVNEIKSKFRGEDGLKHLITGTPLAKWTDAAIKTEIIVGVVSLSLHSSLVSSCERYNQVSFYSIYIYSDSYIPT